MVDEDVTNSCEGRNLNKTKAQAIAWALFLNTYLSINLLVQRNKRFRT
jgi:hypothetical protein